MRKLLLIAGLLLIGVFSAAAAVISWSVPGWYQVVDDFDFGIFIEGGPLADEATCLATLPADNEDEDYSCDYLATKPSWD